MTLLDVVIPTFRDGAWLIALLRTIADQDLADVQVTLAFDRSESPALMPSDLPSVRNVQADRGIGSGRNAGAAAGDAEWILFLDADGLLPPTFLADVKALIRGSEQFDAATFNFFADSHRMSLRAGTRLSWHYLRLMTLLGRPALPGFATLVRRDAFERVGGYRNDLAISEDFVLSDDLLATGYSIKAFARPWLVYSARRFDLPVRQSIKLFWWYLVIDFRRRARGRLIPIGEATYPFGAHEAPPVTRRRPSEIKLRRLR